MITPTLKAFSFVLFLAAASAAHATVLQVANNGLDAPNCGTKAAPCRSITRAIDLAADGDSIVVGPGRYGDLDRDGTLGEVNEEGPETGAMILVDKSVSITSSTGAVGTIIDVAGFNRTGVRITASGARFGKAKKGFTVFDSSGAGVNIQGAASNVVVEGNLAILTNAGFATGGQLVQGNVASATTEGFVLGSAGGSLARGNLSVVNSIAGFDAGGIGTQRMEGNVAIGNDSFGFLAGLHNAVELVGNVAVGNGQGVFAGNGGSVTITGLAALANVQGGVHNQGTPAVSVSASNLVGNGAKALGGSANCGTINENNPLTATNVFWGASTGPGADPADQACDVGNQVTTVAPFAAKPFKIKTKVPQP